MIHLKEIARAISSIKSDSEKHREIGKEKIESINQQLPHGSGIDGKHEIDVSLSDANKIVIQCDYHHMDDGSYTEWTSYRVTITPHFLFDWDIKISGKDIDGTIEYLKDLYADIFEL